MNQSVFSPQQRSQVVPGRTTSSVCCSPKAEDEAANADEETKKKPVFLRGTTFLESSLREFLAGLDTKTNGLRDEVTPPTSCRGCSFLLLGAAKTGGV